MEHFFYMRKFQVNLKKKNVQQRRISTSCLCMFEASKDFQWDYTHYTLRFQYFKISALFCIKNLLDKNQSNDYGLLNIINFRVFQQIKDKQIFCCYKLMQIKFIIFSVLPWQMRYVFALTISLRNMHRCVFLDYFSFRHFLTGFFCS